MIQAIALEQHKEWDDAVKRLADYDAFYLHSYMKAFALQGSGHPLLIVYSDGNDYAINAVFRRDIAQDSHFNGKIEKGVYFDLSSPYGYGGFIGQVENQGKMLQEWNQYCRENGYISEFVRFELFSDYWTYFDGDVECRTHNVVRNLDMPLDEMWMDFKQKVRKNVKRANAHRLEFIVDKEGAYLDDFLRIYYGTMNRVNAAGGYFFSREFFETIREMKENAIFFHVRHQGKIISTELVLCGSENCYSYLGGTDQEFFELRPNDFLKYEIIKWCREKGMKNFVFGGGYGEDDGIFQYKSCFAPRGILDFRIGKKIFDQRAYDELIKIRKENGPFDESSGFFPAYRAQ